VKRLIVYAGANGAGKSSLRAGGGDPVEIEIDPDRIARSINPENPRSVDLAAGKEALRQFDQALTDGRSLSLETTLTGRTVLARMQMAKDAGYDVTLRYVGVRDADLNVARVQARTAEGGHWIAEEVVRRRVGNSLANLPAAIAIADRAVLLDNTGLAHKPVLEVERGRVLFQAPDAPPWLTGQLPGIAAALGRVSPEDRSSSGPLPFDPFGDRATRGHLRNKIGTTDVAMIARLEALSFAATVMPALEALQAAPTLDYRHVLDTHRRLFSSVYPWAGQDRAALAAEIALGKAGISDLFAGPGDAQRGIEIGLRLGLDPTTMRSKPGEVFNRLAHAHPFLDGNGRVLMTVHADLARRADFHIDWSQISKAAFMSALTNELQKAGTAMDALLRPHVRIGALPIAQTANALKTVFGLNKSGSSPSM